MLEGGVRQPMADRRAGGGWQHELECALEELGHVGRLLENGAPPTVDLRRAADELTSCYAAIFEAYDLLSEPALALGRALSALQTARGVLMADAPSSAALGFAVDYCDRAAQHLERAAEWTLGQPALKPVPSFPLKASVQGLRVHTLNRPRFVPTFRVPEVKPEVFPELAEPLPTPATFEELERAIAELNRRAEERQEQAEQRSRPVKGANPEPADTPAAPPPGFARDALKALDEREFMRARARECFEEIVMVGIQRTPLEGDPWRSVRSIERRLLANLDALVALGPEALGHIEPLVLDFPVRDEARVWAVTVVFGSIAGRDALSVAQRVFVASEAAIPEAARAFDAALRLVRHPHLETLLRRLQTSPVPAHRALAISVLAHHGWASWEDLNRAAQDAPEVAARALPLFALSGHPTLRSVLDRALAEPDPALLDAAWTAAVYAHHPHIESMLRAELAGARAGFAAHLLAISGSEQQVLELEHVCRQAARRELVDALGWAGSPSSVPFLISLLAARDEALRQGAADALARITGHRVLSEVLVPPEQLDVPDAPSVPGSTEPSLAQLISDPRDLPEEGSPDVMQRVSTDAAVWQEFWSANASRFMPGRRYRRGVPHSALVVWNELTEGPCSFAERTALARELILASGAYAPFDPGDFVWQQEADLRAWEPVARRASGRLGAFGPPVRTTGYSPRTA